MPPLSFSRKIAFRYLWSRRSEAFITIISVISVIGVAIGVMVLNIVMAVMTGFEHELRDKIVSTNSHVVVRKLSGKITNWKNLSEAIKTISGVESVSPFTYHQALLTTKTGNSGVLIRGILPDTSAAKQLGRYMEGAQPVSVLFDPPLFAARHGDGDDQTSRMVKLPAIVIGRELARSYGIVPGTAVSLLAPQVGSTPFGLVPRFKRFVVAGTYSSGLVEYESGLAYASMDDAQKFFRMGDAISGLEIRVRDILESSRVTREIMNLSDGTAAGIYAQDWTEVNKPLWDAIKLEKKVYFLVLLLIIVMASFSIITTLVMIVLEKRRDIAILMTMGATSASIRNIFRTQGMVIGAVGTIAGLLAGYFGCVALRKYGFPIDERIFQMSTVPVRIEFFNFLVTGVVAFLICCFATVYPARRASRLEPSEVLRYE